MNKDKESRLKKITSKVYIPKPWDSIIILALNVLITIPLFIIIHHNIIDPDWPYQIDRIILFILIVLGLQFLLNLFKTTLIFCIFIYILFLVWGSLFDGYGFMSIVDDYRVMIFTMSNSPRPQDIIISKLLPFPNKTKIINAVEYTNPTVRNFALLATTKHFTEIKGYSENRQIIQCFAIFKEVRNRWNYVNDPKNREYIASASESLQHFSGDCDDHAILMSALILSVGGTPRIIHTKEHLYPEILIGTKADLEKVNFLIREVLFKEETKGKKIFYHIDEYGQVWLNLDYTARYPGGPFMSEEILGALTLN